MKKKMGHKFPNEMIVAAENSSDQKSTSSLEPIQKIKDGSSRIKNYEKC